MQREGFKRFLRRTFAPGPIERKAIELQLSAERTQLRQGAAPEQSDDDFRAERARRAEFSLGLLLPEVFGEADGALTFDIPKDGELWNDLAEAFQAIRDAVQNADILRGNKQVAAAQTRIKLVTARDDKGLQSVLQDVKRLRLVHSAPDDEQG